jgi:hypothetical protein
MTIDTETDASTCRCGRDLRKLNAASDTPKCVGCGYVSELCRCEDVAR